MEKKNIFWIDMLRVLACIMVIFIHAPLPCSESSYFLSISNYISSSCIGLFFMISGALLLPIKEITFNDLFNRRCKKILFPLLFWSAFYLIIILYRSRDIELVLNTLLLFPFKPVNGVLWFVYTLLGLYLFALIISPFLKVASKGDLQVIIALWFLTLIFPYINMFVPGIYNIDGSIHSIVFYFSGFAGYFIFGYYLMKFPFAWKKNLYVNVFIVCLLSVLVFFPFFIYFLRLELNDNSLFYNYLTINIALLTALIFSFFQSNLFKKCVELFVSKFFENLISDISKMSFGIYLVHIFILRDIVWYLFDFKYFFPIYIQVPLMVFITFSLSYVIVKCISFLSKSKYIIGV